MPPPPPSPSEFAPFAQSIPRLVPDYQSIGEFYKELKNGEPTCVLVHGCCRLSFHVSGICEVSKRCPNLFSHNGDQQFIGEEFFGKSMTVVVDTKTALKALETIVDQGEGSIGVPDSHYSIFVELHQRRMEWECIDYIDEPRTAKYGENQLAYRVCHLPCFSSLADTVTAILAVAGGRCVLLLPSEDNRLLLGGGVAGKADAAVP